MSETNDRYTIQFLAKSNNKVRYRLVVSQY